MRRRHLTLCLLFFLPLGATAQQTLVRIETSFGDVEIALYDQQAPVTVSNFLAYIAQGTYDKTFFHRSVPGFVLQGGGFNVVSNFIFGVQTAPPIVNEAGLENRRGTLAMARTSDPDSATSQWFINLTDNPGLDPTTNAPGYAVFGRVLGDGMNVVDQLAAVPAYNVSDLLGPTFSQLPLLQPELSTNYFLWVHQVRTIPFAIDRMEPDGTLHLQGPQTPFELQRSDSLAANAWSTLVRTNGTARFTDAQAGNQPTAVYRLVVRE